jgi:hypothetical protein
LVARLLVALNVKEVCDKIDVAVPVIAPVEVLKLSPAPVSVASGLSEKLVATEAALPRLVTAKLALCPLVATSVLPYEYVTIGPASPVVHVTAELAGELEVLSVVSIAV